MSPAMGSMLTEMKGCLWWPFGKFTDGIPRVVAQMIAAKMAPMHISPDHDIVQNDCDYVLASKAHVQMAALNVHVQ